MVYHSSERREATHIRMVRRRYAVFKSGRLRGLLIFGVGLLAGLIIAGFSHVIFPKGALAQVTSKDAPDLAAMQADIAHLKEVVPSQSHTMTDVGYQFANLWFAGRHRNWPLADFFLNEARQHIVWTIRIRPVRKNPDGGSIDIRAMFEGISDGALKELTQSIAKKDETAFTASYKKMLEACYSCHVAAAKPYLRPEIPTVPPQTIINFDPEAKWPH
jgi:hypothetical protein